MRRDCLVCGAPDAHEHHSLPKSVWPQFRTHPDVFIPLCFGCHGLWHEMGGPVAVEDLPPRTRALIEAHASPDWIARWYPSRLDADLPF